MGASRFVVVVLAEWMHGLMDGRGDGNAMPCHAMQYNVKCSEVCLFVCAATSRLKHAAA